MDSSLDKLAGHMEQVERKYHIGRLSPLIGATVDSICVSFDGDMDGAWTGLVLRTKDGRLIQLVAQSDPEGNGPGWIDLQVLEQKPARRRGKAVRS